MHIATQPRAVTVAWKVNAQASETRPRERIMQALEVAPIAKETVQKHNQCGRRGLGDRSGDDALHELLGKQS